MTLRSSCNGLPDCNPPNSFVGKVSLAFVASFILFYAAQLFKYNLDKQEASFIIVSVLISSIIISVLFIYIFIEWARRPQSAPGRQNNPCYNIDPTNPNCFDDRLTPEVRNRDLNALIFGFAMGLFYVIPRAVIECNGNEDLLLANGLMLLAFVIAAVVIRRFLQMPATDVSPKEFNFI